MNRIRFTSMLLGCALLAAWSQSSQAAPVAKSSSPCANPRGVRLTIRSFFRVTNSADGFHDDEVEVYGYVHFNRQPVWRVARGNAIDAVDDATDRDRRKIIHTSMRTFDVIYDNPSTWKLRVDGYLKDRDRGSDDDVLWNPRNEIRELNMRSMYEQRKAGGNNLYFLGGDHKSESADLTLVIVRSTDIF